MWSVRQTAECTWFVSLNGYDTVSAWNAYLLSQSLPQDCTASNIGSSTYPYRSWAAVVADSRSVSGDKVAVGLGKWGSECQRTVVTKSMYWLGMTGTVIDMYLCNSTVFKALLISECYDTLIVVNGEINASMSFSTASFAIFKCVDFDFFLYNNSSSIPGCIVRMDNCLIKDMFVPAANSLFNVRSNNSNFMFSTVGRFATTSILVSCITKIAGTCNTYFSCFTDPASTQGSSNNIISNPIFNTESIGDYTLSPASPCLYKGKNGTHIGALGEARTINPNSPEMADGTAVYSLTGGLTDLVKTSYDVGGVTMYMLSLRTGKMSGTVETGWIDLGRTREVDSLRFVADMIYGAGGNYAQAPSPDLNKLSVSRKCALTEAEKAGVAWVSTEWGAEDLAVSARYIKILITVTSTTPAP